MEATTPIGHEHVAAERMAHREAMQWLTEQPDVDCDSPSLSPARSPERIIPDEGTPGDAVESVLDRASRDDSFRQALVELLQDPNATRRANLEASWSGAASSASPPVAQVPVPASPPRVLVPFSPRPGQLIGAQLGIFSGWGYLLRKQTWLWLRHLVGSGGPPR